MKTKYRVRRKVIFKTRKNFWVSDPATIWRGDDPNQYKGGIGIYDDHPCYPKRWFECFQFGAWNEIDDPRQKETKTVKAF